MSKHKSQKVDDLTMTLYHRVGVELVPGGYCGPGVGREIPVALAQEWIKQKDWSTEPFISIPIEERTPLPKVEVTDNE